MVSNFISNIIKNFSRETKLLKEYTIQSNKILEYMKEYKDCEQDFLLDIYSSNDTNKSIAAICVAANNSLGLTPYKVQIIGVLSIINGNFIEMKTGEGKSLVAALASLYNSKEGNTYIVTVNEYLAHRDAEELKPLYDYLKVNSNYISNDMPIEKKVLNYKSKILYGTNNTFAFDYLKDNLTYNSNEVCQKTLDNVIIDEADSILIDEARTPLIISGSAEHNVEFFLKSFAVARQMKEEHFKIDMENKSIVFNNNAFDFIEKLLGINNLYTNGNFQYSHQILQSLKAIHTMRKDVDYILSDGKVKIIDEFNGRILKDTRFGNGLHQAIEAKENVEIKEENENLAQTTYQNYFNLFSKKSGMSGTLISEKKEFAEIYNSLIIEIPTNRDISRIDHDDKLFVSTEEKIDYLIKEIVEIHKSGRPLLIGTLHIKQSDDIAEALSKLGLKYNLLNAKQHEQEAEIIKNAGLKGSITIATNMAGRGVDIKIDKEILNLGGLYVIGFERYQNRRVDNQLKGRSGRQGNSGDSMFLLSLDDEILTFSKDNFLYKRLKSAIDEEEAGVSLDLLNNIVKKQQSKIENVYFDSRKEMFKYSKIISDQRDNIYAIRKEILFTNIDDESPFKEKLNNYAKDIIKVKTIEEIQNEFSNPEIKAIEDISKVINDKIDNKEAVLRYDIKNIFLETIDRNWRLHLQESENIKQGNHHKARSNKDPLIEYQLEMAKQFRNLIFNIKYELTQELYHYDNDVSYEELTDTNKLAVSNPLLDNIIQEINTSFNTFIEVIEKSEEHFDNIIQSFITEIVEHFTNNVEDIDNVVIELSSIFQINIEDNMDTNAQIDNISKVIHSNVNKNISKFSDEIKFDIFKDVTLHFIFDELKEIKEKIDEIYSLEDISENSYKELEYSFILSNFNIKVNVINNLIHLEVGEEGISN
jgi:preprotein translocase subunit SecA